jgi:hypothetical protein
MAAPARAQTPQAVQAAKPAARQPSSTPAPRPSEAVRPAGAPFVRLAPLRSAPPTGAPPQLRALLVRDAGEPLTLPVRGMLERSFGVDLAPVRVHQGPQAAPLVDGAGARALTFGTHVVLGSRERATDLALMAHEVAHVLQQQGAPRVQNLGGRDTPDALEHEADRAAAAVAAGRPARVLGHTAARPQFSVGGWLRRQASAAAGAVTGAASAVAGAVGDIVGAAFNFIRDRARAIPGYDLLAFVLGRDPISQQPVERNAVNLIRAMIGLWPGGALIFQALERYGIIERVGSWVQQQLANLGLAAGAIREALDRFISTLSASDVLNLGAVWDRARRIFSEPIDRVRQFVRGLVDGVLGFIRDAVLRPLARLAEGTRGYDLLKLVLGQDPITGDPYPRTPANVIGGFMRLIGQEEKWQHLQQSRAIPRAWAWFQAQMGTLLGFVRQVPQLFLQALRSLQIGDLLNLGGAFARMRAIFGGFVGSFVSWAGNAAVQVMMFIFEVLAPGAMPVLRRAAGVIRTIVSEPIRFVGNLVRAGVQGFRQFGANIRTHLVSGLVGWLTGALTGAGLQLPQRWDLRGILSLVLQILGLTWQNIRQKLLRHIPEPVLRTLETTFDIVVTLVREGPAAAWQKIVEQLGNLQEMVFGQIRDWVARTVVGQAIIRIASMLNPAGAVIQAIIAIYNTIMFFRERLQQIIQVAESFFNSIAAIAGGAIAAAATRVEQTMGRLVPVVISFLARLIGLGGISDTIRNIINRIRAPVDRALDRVVDWIVAQARRLGRAVVAGARSVAQRVLEWWRERREFEAGGERHAVYFRGQEGQAELMVASRPVTWDAFVSGLASYPGPQGIAAKNDALAAATTLRNTMRRPASAFAPPNTKEVRVREELNALAVALGRLLRLSPPGTNLYPGSGLDPRTRTVEQLWSDILPAPIPGTTEAPREIEQRRVLARGRLLDQYPANRRPTAQAMIDFNLGRDIKAFNLAENESANPADAHTEKRHVLNGSGEIKDRRDLALRVLLNVPTTGGTWTAGTYRSSTNAGQAIRAAIAGEMTAAGGWPAFRERIIATTGNASAIPGDVSASPAGEIFRNPAGAVVTVATLPAYLATYTFQGIPLVGAAGTRPLYPGDPQRGLAGNPLVIAIPLSGNVRVVMRTRPTARGGWFVLTSYPVP